MAAEIFRPEKRLSRKHRAPEQIGQSRRRSRAKDASALCILRFPRAASREGDGDGDGDGDWGGGTMRVDGKNQHPRDFRRDSLVAISRSRGLTIAGLKGVYVRAGETFTQRKSPH
jgi:hypothetical protein